MTETIVVIPCYNEAERLEVPRFAEFVDAHDDLSLLFVNDGSTDGTAEVLEKACAPSERMSAHHLDRNCGKAEAVRQGVQRAMESDPEFVGFWDADLATPLEDILLFRSVLRDRENLSGVIGSRVNLLGRDVRRNLMRHYVGRVFATAAVTVLKIPIYDTQCGAKLFRVRDDVRGAFAEPFVSKWIFDVELIARLRNHASNRGQDDMGHVLFEQPLMRWTDVAGSKLKLRHFVTVGLDLFRIWRRYPARRGSRS